MAGCVPVEGKPLDYEFPWHDCLIPVAKYLTAIERAVFECAYAGCRSVWITAPFSTMPILRKVLGDYVVDPYRYFQLIKRNVPEKTIYKELRRVPVYYVPTSLYDIDRVSSLGWSAVNSAFYARKVCKKITKYLAPDKYYVAFPYGVYRPEDLMPHRKQLLDRKEKSTRIILSHDNKTVKDNEYLGFTLSSEELDQVRTHVFQNGRHVERTESFEINNNKYEKRIGDWIAPEFGVGDVFSSLDFGNKDYIVDVNSYYNIDTWDGYLAYMQSGDTLISYPKRLKGKSLIRIQNEKN